MSSDFLKSITTGVFNTPSPEPTSSPGGGGNNTPIISQNIEEIRRLDLYSKLEQLTASFNGPNKGKTMNSPTLVNLEFTADNRNYMLYHLHKFHPDKLGTNGFKTILGKGFGCTMPISQERLALFSDINK